MNNHHNPISTNNWRAFRLFRLGGGLLIGTIGLMFLLLTLFVVPAPGTGTAIEVSGRLVSLSYPHPASGDISIRLDNGRGYYINRVNEAAVDWKKMLSTAQPGDEVHLTVVLPLARRLAGDGVQASLPVAGVQIGGVAYMDPAISAATWTAQARFTWIAVVLLVGATLCFLPELQWRFKQLQPI